MFRDDATYPATFDRQRKAEVAPELRDTDVLSTFREKIEKVCFVPEADVVFRHAWSINPLDRCTLPGFSYKPGDTTSNNHFEMVFNGFAWYLA